MHSHAVAWSLRLNDRVGGGTMSQRYIVDTFIHLAILTGDSVHCDLSLCRPNASGANVETTFPSPL